ncbi:hypothetical protein V865_003510 [Kwoniella europaea PYCC6329]|uniref:Uncharacterized protein n=1 Tax=Kwoniella europaea PYCC6329 TaxID=1423913 RepID=A0AAX4KI54_9TREE
MANAGSSSEEECPSECPHCEVCEEHVDDGDWHSEKTGHCQKCGDVVAREDRNDKTEEYETKRDDYLTKATGTLRSTKDLAKLEKAEEDVTEAYQDLIEAKGVLKKAKEEAGYSDTEDSNADDDVDYVHPNCDE